jgi:hypothetical protein
MIVPFQFVGARVGPGLSVPSAKIKAAENDIDKQLERAGPLRAPAATLTSIVPNASRFV